MIFFELEDEPLSQSITNDQFASLHEIVAQDWSRNYVVADYKGEGTGDWFLRVTRMNDGDTTPDKKFNVDSDGTWEEVQ